MHKYTVCVIGGNACQAYLAEYLNEQGMAVHTHNDFNPSYLEGCDLLIGPADFYTDGILRSDINEACATYHVPVVNYMSNREFLIANAELTAEGLLSYVIMNTPFTLNGATGLILGFGRCGSAIAKRLHVLGCRVDAYDLIPEQFENPESYDFIINTIPATVITEEILKPLRKNCILFDIAPAPGGFDKNAVTYLGLNLINCPDIPEITAPKTAGYTLGALAISYLN